jgi:putative oxidoreductase
LYQNKELIRFYFNLLLQQNQEIIMTTSTNNNAALILRVVLGVILVAHSGLKIFIFTIPGTIDFFNSLGLPAAIAYLTIYGELLAGFALIIGTYARLAALSMIPILLGATWTHAGNGWVFSNNGGGWEFPALLVMIAIIVSIQGAGSYAVKKLPLIDRFIPTTLKA